MVKYLFRKPKLPLLVDTDRRVYGISKWNDFDKLVSENKFKSNDNYTAIDATGEGWSYIPEHNVISPLILHKRWFKKDIIRFFNESLAD